VRDGDLIQSAPGWEIVQGPQNFTMSGNHNLGWLAVEPDSDILNMNDDIYFLESDPIQKLTQLAYGEPRIGCVSARCKVGFMGNPLQCNPRQEMPLTFVKTCTNASAYFRRDMIREVGYYDESFTEKYGAEDADYTTRINLAGWKVGIARDVPVKHGYGSEQCTSTSTRAIPNLGNEALHGVEHFRKKHGHFDVLGEKHWDFQTVK